MDGSGKKKEGKAVASKPRLNSQIAGHSNVPKKAKYNCTFEDCGYSCNLIRSMNRHVIRFHKKSESLQKSIQKRNGKGNKKDKFECKSCCVKFQSATLYIHHYQKVHDGVPPGMAIPVVEKDSDDF